MMKGTTMNKVTRDIAELLKIDLDVALKIQDAMECDGFDFSRASERTFKREAKYQYSLIA